MLHHLLSAGEPTSERVAFYGMWSALGVAFIGGSSALLKQYLGAGASVARARKVLREYEAYERFLLLRNIDIRHIKTGYETDEEVRHVAPTSD